jgi:hypothetical protein
LNYFLKIDSRAKYEIYVPCCSANVGSASPSSIAGRNIWRIYVYTREINYDPFLYPEPMVFNPWRWLVRNIASKCS